MGRVLPMSLRSFPRARPSAPDRPEASWDLPEVAGRVVEVSGREAPACLTAAFALVLDAQRRGEAVAWIALPGSTFYPPDAASGGVDLRAVAVVQAPDPVGAAIAADELLRAGAFGLVVVDLEGVPPHVPAAAQSRLSGLARKHDAAVIFLTRKGVDDPSLGSLVSLRAEARRTGRAGLEVRVLKDKRRGPGRTHREDGHGPAGLR